MYNDNRKGDGSYVGRRLHGRKGMPGGGYPYIPHCGELHEPAARACRARVRGGLRTYGGKHNAGAGLRGEGKAGAAACRLRRYMFAHGEVRGERLRLCEADSFALRRHMRRLKGRVRKVHRLRVAGLREDLRVLREGMRQLYGSGLVFAPAQFSQRYAAVFNIKAAAFPLIKSAPDAAQSYPEGLLSYFEHTSKKRLAGAQNGE